MIGRWERRREEGGREGGEEGEGKKSKGDTFQQRRPALKSPLRSRGLLQPDELSSSDNCSI